MVTRLTRRSLVANAGWSVAPEKLLSADAGDDGQLSGSRAIAVSQRLRTFDCASSSSTVMLSNGTLPGFRATCANLPGV